MPTGSREDKQWYWVPSPGLTLSFRPVQRPSKRPMHLPTRTVSGQLWLWMCCSRVFHLLRSPEIIERPVRMWIRRKSRFLRNRL